MNLELKKTFLRILFFLAFALLLPGCGVWNSFTTYFNLYYNASDIFEQAEKSIYEQKRDLFSNQPITVPANANTQLTKVIEKCSRILQFSSETGFVDDALIMLGKSFYYQRNYQKAVRKFEELIATQTESSLYPEAELWLGKSYMRLKNYNKGLELLNKVRGYAIAEDEEELLKETYVEEIIYFLAEESYLRSIELANEFLGLSDDDVVNAEVQFEVGKLFNKTNSLENAVAAFEKVFEYSPDYDLEQRARIEYGRALRNSGRYEDALLVFEDMGSEDKYASSIDVIEVEKGITLSKLGKIEDALISFKLVDSLYQSSKHLGAARYEIGKIFEENYKNLDSASFFYTKATGSALPEDYILPAREKDQLFKKYVNLKKQIIRFDRQLFYALNPSEYSKDSLEYVQDSLRALSELEIKDLFGNNLPGDTTRNQVQNPDSVNQTNQQGFFITGNEEPDSLGDKGDPFGNNPNRNRGENRNLSNLSNQNQGINKNVKLNLTRKKPVLPTISLDSLKTILAKNKLEMGNLFLTEFNLSDSAYKYYDQVLTNYPDTRYKASLLYAMGTYYLTAEDSIKSDSIFNYIYDNFKNESIVNAAAIKINKPLVDLNYDPARDLYLNAEEKMKNKNFDASANDFYEIFIKYPQSAFAPKALYSAGYILENELGMPDSAAMVYERINVKYPSSTFAMKIRPKLNTWKQEQERKRRVIEDTKKQQEVPDVTSEDSLKILLNEVETPGEESVNPLNQMNEILNEEDNPGNEKSDSLRQNLKGEDEKKTPQNGNVTYLMIQPEVIYEGRNSKKIYLFNEIFLS
jgi:tetratricopeptide (TPR) repeat protein